MTASATLLVLPPSHYCERARWALQDRGIPFAEEGLAVGLHAKRVKAIAPKSTLPVLVRGDEIVQGSGAILDWTGMEGRDAEVESRFERRVGVSVRAFVYCATLADPRSGIRERLFAGLPRRQALIGSLMWPMTRRLMARGMDIRPERLPDLATAITADLDWIAARLDGRAYLVDQRFGRADLTVASLLSPLVQMAAPTSPLRVSPAAADVLAGWRAHPALAFARRMYADHRRRPAA